MILACEKARQLFIIQRINIIKNNCKNFQKTERKLAYFVEEIKHQINKWR